MNRCFLVAAFVLLMVFGADPCAAQTSATQPSDQVRVRFNQMERDEQKAVTDWMKLYMPNLAKLIADQPESPRPFKRNRLLNAAAARYRTYQQAKDSQSALESVMKSVRIENEIFGYVTQLEDAPTEKRLQLQEKIQTRTRALVDLFLSDRADRIKRLQDRLDAEQRTLDSDRAHANLLVEQRLAHFMVEPATKPADDSPASSPTAP